MKKKTILLAMSGGVDSSVAAYLLQRKGYAVIGITFKLWQDSACKDQKPKDCCSLDSIKDAKELCGKLGIPHYVLDCAKEFKAEVIDSFLNSYKKGLTPNPCIICNEKIKFPLLLEMANSLGADYIATGHYAICKYNRKLSRFMISEGRDKNKDQSYVLFSLGQEALSHLKLPLGDNKKNTVRLIAKKLEINAYNRKESQEICFIKDDNLKRFLRENLGSSIKKGIIKDANNRLLASHEGTCFFTIGQRRGLRIPYGSPIYVTDIDPETAEITVGNYSDTLKKYAHVKGVNWIINPGKAKILKGVKVKIRYKHKKARADINIDSRNNLSVMFKKPQSAFTPGQAAVFYKNSTVIGGGWITRD
jgi:tRNA-uridine 2-sulfurtransferase